MGCSEDDQEGKEKDAEKALAVLLLLYSGMREGEPPPPPGAGHRISPLFLP